MLDKPKKQWNEEHTRQGASASLRTMIEESAENGKVPQPKPLDRALQSSAERDITLNRDRFEDSGRQTSWYRGEQSPGVGK